MLHSDIVAKRFPHRGMSAYVLIPFDFAISPSRVLRCDSMVFHHSQRACIWERNAARAKRGPLQVLATALLAFSLLMAAVPCAWAVESEEHASKAEEYARAEAEKKVEASNLQQNIDLLQTHINELQAEYDAALEEHDAAAAAVLAAERRVHDAQVRIVHLQDSLGNRAVSMYKTGGNQSLIDVMLGASTFDEFLRSWDALERIADQDAKWVQEMKDARAEAVAAREEAERQRQIAGEKMQVAEAAKVEQEASMAQLQSMLSQVTEEIAILDSLVEEEEMAAEEAKRLEEEAARLAAQKFHFGSAEASLAAVNSEGWTYPLPEGWRVSSEYGTRVHPVTGQVSSFHSGIDLAMPLGTPVYAAKDGTVTYVGWYGTGGQAIIVNHGDGIRTVYMHLSGYNTHTGATVSAGDCIGFVGTTGRSTGPHLHFNVEIDNTPVNPRLVMDF